MSAEQTTPSKGKATDRLSKRATSAFTGSPLGKLADVGVQPWVVLFETLLLPAVMLLIGFVISPRDPLWVHAEFHWAWLAPLIVSLRYGPLAGLGASGVLLAGWLGFNFGDYDLFPQVFFLGGLIMTMLVGEFSSLWRARTRRAESVQHYLDQRLEHLIRQYYLLRLSHDRLEQELIGRPMSMRDALKTLRGLGGEAYGLLVIDDMPFFSLQEENLQTINLLLGYYTDGLSSHALAQPLLQEVPDCPVEFAFEMQRLYRMGQSTRVPSIVVALEFTPKASERNLPQQILRLKRMMDEVWLLSGGRRDVLAVLMPMGDSSTAEGFIARLEGWMGQKEGHSLADAGIFPHKILLGDAPPLSTLQRLHGMAHA